MGLPAAEREDCWFEVIMLPAFGHIRENEGLLPSFYMYHALYFIAWPTFLLIRKDGGEKPCAIMYIPDSKNRGRLRELAAV
jgi:hypothetical protein